MLPKFRVFVQVCATPGDARGYDPGLGLCLCWGQHSSGMCGSLCPEGQSHILRLSCSEGIPHISITEDPGSQVQCPEDQPHAKLGQCSFSLLRGNVCDTFVYGI